VGPHGTVLFFNPAIQAAQGGTCDETSPSFDSRRCSVPLGGRSLWEASVAYRFAIVGALHGALFCDARDVAEQGLTIVVQRPHLACGLGPRYDTPVGPIRLDVGYRIPGLQVLDDGDRLEGDPGDILGLPVNISLGIGQAY
jgi:outer membrane protein insertion porin family/translocation and assembly module TamA